MHFLVFKSIAMQFIRARGLAHLAAMTRPFLFTVLRHTRPLPPGPVVMRVLFSAGVGKMSHKAGETPASIYSLIALAGCMLQK